MDVFEEVERIRPEIEGAEGNVAVARARLTAEFRNARRLPRSREARRWFLTAGIAGALAAVTAGVLIAGSFTGSKPAVVAHRTSEPGHTPSTAPTSAPPATAAPETPQTVLNAASAAAIRGGLSPQSGQYLRVAWTSDVLLLGDDSTIAQPGGGGSYETATRAWVIRGGGTLYIPADVTGDWYSGPPAPLSVDAVYGDATAEDPRLRQFLDRWNAAGQEGFESGGGPLPEGDGTSRGEFLSSLPPDAAGVLAWLRARQNGASEYHQEAMVGWTLMSLLACNAGGGEVRAAMLQALAALPGSSIVDSRGSVRTIAFDSTFGDESAQVGDVRRHQTITVDVASGRVSGISDSTNPGGGVVPGGVVDQRQDFEVSLVDGLPG